MAFKGVALKVRNLEKTSAADIINFHYKKMKECGNVYYSTDIAFDMARVMEEVVFFFIYKGEHRFVVADIISADYRKDGWIPQDSNVYSPEKYVNEEKKTWFMLKNMRTVDKSFIDNCEVHYTDGSFKPLNEVLEYPRLNRVYYNRLEDTDDILIK